MAERSWGSDLGDDSRTKRRACCGIFPGSVIWGVFDVLGDDRLDTAARSLWPQSERRAASL
jgi:hypothetical protein